MSLNPEDYKEPRCLSCTDFYYPDENANVTPIPVDRVVDRLDILLSHNDMPAARRHLEYWFPRRAWAAISAVSLRCSTSLWGSTAKWA